jgi:hypothetical protein
MDVPVDPAVAAWATVAIVGAERAGRPRWLVELHLINLPRTAPAEQEGQRDRPADRQQLGRPDLQFAGTATDLAAGAAAPAAEPGGREVARAEALVAIDRDTACRVTARAVDVQLQAVSADVAYSLKWKRTKHACDVQRALESSACTDSKRCGMRARSSAGTLYSDLPSP